MAFGVTEAGFIKPTDAEVEQSLVEDFKAEFGSDITLAPETFLGQQLAIYKKRELEFFDALESVYLESFFVTSTGVNLDRTAFPFVRNLSQKATVVLTFTGDDMAVVPIGSLAETAEGIQFQTTALGTIDITTVDINAIAVVAGVSGNQAVGAITELPVTITGVDSVTNNTPATDGKDIESDADFNVRVKVESRTSKSSSVAAVRFAVLALEDITQVTVKENATDVTVNGLPSHSIQVVVNGAATDEDIANAIFQSKPAGIGTFGAESFVISEGGELFTINFDRSVLVNIFADVNLTVDSSYISANDDIVRARVLEYIGGIDPSGAAFPGLSAGEDVLIWKVSAALFNLESPDDLGITDVNILLSRTINPTLSETIIIAATEEAITDFSQIVVNT